MVSLLHEEYKQNSFDIEIYKEMDKHLNDAEYQKMITDYAEHLINTNNVEMIASFIRWKDATDKLLDNRKYEKPSFYYGFCPQQ